MTEQDLKNAIKEGKVEEVKEEKTPVSTVPPIPPSSLPLELGQYLVILEGLKTVKRHLTAAPTFVPQNFADQIQLYDDGVDRRIYVYVNGTWRYAALT